MIYVVHTVRDGERRKFATFSRAFKEFKASLRNEQHSSALWAGSSHGGWTRVYQSEMYPEKYTSPYIKD